jgi:uncharacterized protein (DUF736 family)
MTYDNTDTGALFKNDKKGNEKAPDYTGDIYDASGNKRRIAAWLKVSASGKNYMSLKIEDLRQQPPKDYGATEPEVKQDSFDDIPF